MSLTLVVGSDHAGLRLKQSLLAFLESRGVTFHDVGTHSNDSCDYPDFAHRAMAEIEAGKATLGLLVCGSGVGMSMAANRHSGIRAVVCSEPYSAEMARRHNNANVLCLGERIVGAGLAELILAAFLDADFEGGRHARRVGKITP